jgi:hypothetical protein
MAVRLYKFAPVKGNRVALTADPKGSNLPADGAPWRKIGEISVNRGGPLRIAASEDEIIDAIEADGVLIWPMTDIKNA